MKTIELMSSFNVLFKLDKANTLSINKVELLSIKEYEALWKKDKGSSIDKTGSKKAIAFKWFLYIYLVLDIRSMYSGLSLLERKEKAILHCNFPSDRSFKEDITIQNAMHRYKQDMTLSSTAKSYLAAEKALYTMGGDLNFLQEQIIHNKNLLVKKYRDLSKLDKLEDTDLTLMEQSQLLIDNLSKSQDKVNELIKKFPASKKIVDELLSKFLEEEGSVRAIHGGGELGNREEA